MASFRYVPAEGQAFSANSTVYPNAKRTFYLTGTSTKSNVYQDSALTTPHTNPVVADSAGVFPAIYLNQTITYKVVLQDADDNVLDTTDPVKTELGTGLVPLSGLTPAADKVPYFTSSSAAALADFTSYGRQIVAVSNEAAFKTLVNLEIGTDVQAYHAYLADISGISSPNSGDVIYFDGANWTKQSLSSAASGYPPVRWYIFSAAGADSLTIPYDCYAYIYLIGAGGGGQGGKSGNRTGGGGGEFSFKRLRFDASDVITLNVGAKGTASSAGSDGGNTTAICAAQSLSMTANGGDSGGNGGAGGTGGTGGDLHFDGGSATVGTGTGGGGVDITGQGLADGSGSSGGAGGGLTAGFGIPGLISGGPGAGSTDDATDGAPGGFLCGGGGAADLSSGNPNAGAGGVGGGGGGARGSVTGDGGNGGDGYILIGLSAEIA